MDIILAGLLGSLVAGLMTAVGAIPVLVGRDVSDRTKDTLHGFAAGVMLSASFFSLIIPALDVAEVMHGSRTLAATITVLGIFLGVVVIWVINEHAPHEHFFQGREGSDQTSLRRIWLFVVAITIHNYPEGLAVGVGFGGGDIQNGITLAIGIGLQNLPEGWRSPSRSRARAIAAAGLWRGGTDRARRVARRRHRGERRRPGSAAAALGPPFAAGAMIYVISHEIIPETHRRGFQNQRPAASPPAS